MEQIENPVGHQVIAQPVYQSRTFGQDGGAVLVHPTSGNRYIASRWLNGNWTCVYVRRYSPNMASVLDSWVVTYPGVPARPNPAVLGVGKIDGFSMAPAGRDIVVVLGGHVTNAERENPINVATLAGAWT